MSASSRRRGLASLALAACLPLAGCGTETSPQSGSGPTGGDTTVSPSEPVDGASTPSGTASGPATSGPTGPPGAGGLTSADILRLALEDLAATTGIGVDEITVTTNEAVTWPDSSLGCPQKGSMYLTVLTPGHLIVLEAGGTAYEYHSGQGTAPALCKEPQPPLPAGGSAT